jgi:hypothetical protein
MHRFELNRISRGSRLIDFAANWTSGFGNIRNLITYFSFTITSGRKHRLECFLWKISVLLRIQDLLILVQAGLVVLKICAITLGS